ncbi:asparagine synthase-related protein [Actinosynnema sp. NPDC023794]
MIGAIAADRPGAGYATLLSGGIDSGTVTYLAAARGLDVVPYSVGTPWGDEFADARELCDAAGLGMREVRLDEDAIVRAIPAAVRWLGTAAAEVVEVALTATAVYQAGVLEPGRVLLTGYGSDLIDAGLFTPFERPEELIEQGLESIRRTRVSGELSNRMPMAHGVEAFHPFWTLPVMRVAHETTPACKVREGREKFHLRSAMAEHSHRGSPGGARSPCTTAAGSRTASGGGSRPTWASPIPSASTGRASRSCFPWPGKGIWTTGTRKRSTPPPSRHPDE